MSEGANLPGISWYNRRVVVEAIRAHQPISRSELAESTGLANATMTNIVRQLMAESLVIEAGHAPSAGGKPRTLLRFNPRAGYAVGVLVDSEAMSYVLTDLDGEVLATEQSGGAAMLPPSEAMAVCCDRIGRLCATAGIGRGEILKIGVAAPGPLNEETGELADPPFLGPEWAGFPLVAELQRASGLPVILERDSIAAAVGELWLADAHDKKDFACVFMADGIGTGLFLNSAVFRGASKSAGELAHISVDIDGERCECGKRGCVGLFSAPQVIARLAIESGVVVADDFRSAYRRVQDAYAAHEERSIAIVTRSAHYLAAAVSTMATLLDLQLVVFAGKGFDKLGDAYVDEANRALAERLWAKTPTTVHLSAQGSLAGAVGAACVVLDDVLSPRIGRPVTTRDRPSLNVLSNPYGEGNPKR